MPSSALTNYAHPDAIDFAALLRTRSKRPRRRAAEQDDEIAPSYT
jgi:hypothetical protein